MAAGCANFDYIYGTSAGTSYIINGGTGGATFNVGNLNSLDGIKGALTVNGTVGADNTLTVDDQASSGALTYTLSRTTLARTCAATITYSGATTISVYCGSGGSSDVIDVDGTAGNSATTYIWGGGDGDQINVLASSPDSVLVVDGGVGTNTIRLGSVSRGPGDTAAHNGTLAHIFGAVDPSDSYGSYSLVIDDSGDRTAYPDASLASTELTGLGRPESIYWELVTLNSLTVYGGHGATVFNVDGIGADFSAETIYTGTGDDQVNVDVEDFYPQGLTIHGQGQSEALNVNDQTLTDTTTYAVTTTAVTRTTLTAIQNDTPEVLTLTYDGISSLAINGGSAANSFDLEGTAVGTAYTINAGAANLIDVENAAGSLDDILGPVTINGQADDFSIGDSGSGTGHTYTFTAVPSISPTANRLVRTGAAAITYTGMTTLQMTGAIGVADTFDIESLANNDLTRIYGGGGQDTFSVSPDAQDLDNVSGILDLDASAPGQVTGNASLTIDDQGHAGARNWLYDSGALETLVAYPSVGSTAHGLQVEFSGAVGVFNRVVVNGGSGGNTFTVDDGPSAVPVTINAGAGVNTLVGPDATNTWNITGTNAGTLDGSVIYSSIENLVGGSAVDVFQFAAAGTEASINGGGAPAGMGDWLDYSSLTTPISVNLATGSATNVNGGAAGAVTNIQDVHAGDGGSTMMGDAQGNILVGGSGVDTITGGTGRSLLIGGAARIKSPAARRPAGTSSSAARPATTAIPTPISSHSWRSWRSGSPRILTTLVSPKSMPEQSPAATR